MKLFSADWQKDLPDVSLFLNIERILLILGLVLVLGITGCSWSISGALPDLVSSANDAKAVRKEQNASRSVEKSSDDGLCAADRAVLARSVDKSAKGRGRSVWIRSVDAQEEFRWRNPHLEEIAARDTQQRPNFRALLNDSDSIIAGNAAIILGRDGEDCAKERLVRVVQSPAIALPMRCAAVEALSRVSDPGASESLKVLLEQYGRFGKKRKGAYISQLHAELIHGLARHEAPTEGSPFAAALGSPSAVVRVEALKAWAMPGGSALPIEAADLRTDGDYRVRAAALNALAAKHHSRALEYLQSAFLDNDLHVRKAAIEAMGTLGTKQAVAALKKLQKDPHDAIRAEAVAALARAKLEGAVLEAAGDSSWRVRQKAADALVAFSDRKAAVVAERLLNDQSVEVQQAVVRALQAWPVERSGPILLSAMSKPTFLTRKLAAEQLRAKWAPAGEFPVEGPVQRRAEVLDKLDRLFRGQFNTIVQASFTEADINRAGGQKASEAQLAEVEQLLRQGKFNELKKYGPALEPALEELVLHRKQLLDEAVYHEALPQ
ncbi:MAG: HEAT repeat domain-containing protein, partial [Thermoguttaceae bacterium]